MKKIPSIFKRDWKNNPKLVTREKNPKCDWVFNGEGIPTRKWDGTCCMVRNDKLYKRYDAKFDKKKGIWKSKPEGFEPCQEPDEITGHQPGWIPVKYDNRQEKKENRYFKMAWDLWRLEYEEEGDGFNPSDGTYELVGITVNGNPEMINGLKFIPHGIHRVNPYGFVLGEDLYDSLKRYFEKFEPIEGIVWHHPDGRMAKIKRVDFGLEWPIKRLIEN